MASLTYPSAANHSSATHAGTQRSDCPGLYKGSEAYEVNKIQLRDLKQLYLTAKDQCDHATTILNLLLL